MVCGLPVPTHWVALGHHVWCEASAGLGVSVVACSLPTPVRWLGCVHGGVWPANTYPLGCTWSVWCAYHPSRGSGYMLWSQCNSAPCSLNYPEQVWKQGQDQGRHRMFRLWPAGADSCDPRHQFVPRFVTKCPGGSSTAMQWVLRVDIQGMWWLIVAGQLGLSWTVRRLQNPVSKLLCFLRLTPSMKWFWLVS